MSNLSCPICLVCPDDNEEVSTQFAKTECGHIFCTSCIQHVLCRPRSNSEEEGARYACATRGRCPMCRGTIDLFTLCDASDTNSLIVEKNRDVTTWPIFGREFRERILGGRLSSSDQALILQRLATETKPLDGFGMQFLFNREDNVPTMIFSHKPHFFHFDCRYDLENQRRPVVSDGRLDFDEFHFHEETMTFHGKIAKSYPWTFEEPLPLFDPARHTSRICCIDFFYQSLECILQFSPDGRYIRDGYLACSYFDTSRLHQYPLDGIWEFTRESGEVTSIHVQFHSFVFLGKQCHFFINGEGKALFQWPGSAWVQITKSKILPGSTLAVDEVLLWEPNHCFREWKRKAVSFQGASVLRMNQRFSDINGMGGLHVIYHQVTLDNDQDDIIIGPTYHADTLWGNTFCQAFTVGLASYHFMKPIDDNSDSEYEAYISYENPKTTQWPNLDNGMHIPPRAHFRNIQWNEETRTFKGDILWMEDHGTTWNGDSEWKYEIIFDPTYKFIVSGTCSMADSEPHQFGRDLIYINAALDDIFGEALESASSTGEYIGMLRRCVEDGASENTMQCLGHVAMTVLNRDGESCFDLNL